MNEHKFQGISYMPYEKKEDEDKKSKATTDKEVKGSHDPKKYIETEPILEAELDSDIEDLEEAPLTIQQRRQRGKTMRRFKSKIAMARKRSKKRKASTEKLTQRSKKKARDVLRQRLMKNKKYSQMTPAEKISLDKRMAKIPKTAIERIAKRQLPLVKRAEIERISQMRSGKKKNENYDEVWNSLMISELYEVTGTEALISLVEHMGGKKRYHKMMNKENKVNIDRRFKIYKKNGKKEDIDALHEMAVEELILRAEHLDTTFCALESVYDKGVAMWTPDSDMSPMDYGVSHVDEVYEINHELLGENFQSEMYEKVSLDMQKILNDKSKKKIIDAALKAIGKMAASRGDIQSLGGYAFDVAKSYNTGLSGKQLEKLYKEKN